MNKLVIWARQMDTDLQICLASSRVGGGGFSRLLWEAVVNFASGLEVRILY